MAVVEGQKELTANLKKIKRTATNDIEQALLSGGLRIERDYKLNVSQDGLVDTGRWLGSITHQADDFGSSNPSVQVGSTIKDPPYPKFHEFGTSKHPPKFPLTRAFNANKAKVLKDLAAAFKKGCGL